MENAISFNTKFGWITAIESNNKITKIQFKKTKSKGICTQNLKKLRKDLALYFQRKPLPKILTIKIIIGYVRFI